MINVCIHLLQPSAQLTKYESLLRMSIMQTGGGGYYGYPGRSPLGGIVIFFQIAFFLGEKHIHIHIHMHDGNPSYLSS